MPLESVTYISDLVSTNPVNATDQVSQGDDHIRNIKTGLLNTFPQLTGAVTATQAELNILDGVTATAAQLNNLSSLAAVSVLGRSANSAGAPAAIAAAANDRILRRTGDAVDFGQTTEGMFAANTVPESGLKFAQTTAESGGSVTPSATQYRPGVGERWGAATGANSATALQSGINQGEQATGAPILIGSGRYIVDTAALDADETISIYGGGYKSELELPAAATHRALLIEHPSFTAINGVRLRDFRVDGNAGGAFNSGLIQANNVVGVVIDGLWVHDGSRASGTDGVNGIALSSGNGSGAGPSGTVLNCYLTAMSKGAINFSTDCDGMTAAFNIATGNTGNGVTPGIQLFDAYRSKVIANVAAGNQGRGIFANINSAAGADAYSIIAFNHAYGNGTGTTEGEGIAYTNTHSAEVHARSIILGNIVVDNGDGLAAGAAGATLTAIESVDFVHNRVYDNALHGVLVTAQGGVLGGHIRVNDNTIDSNNVEANASGAGVFVIGEFDTLEICRNKIGNPDGASRHRYGVYFDSSCVINDLTVRDNTITEMVTANYFFGTGGATFNRFNVCVEGRHQTDDTSQDTVFAFPLPDNSAAHVRLSAVGVMDDGSQRAIYERLACVYRDGAGAAIQGGAQTSLANVESNANYDASISVSGNLIVVLIRGDTAQTVNWRWKVEAFSI